MLDVAIAGAGPAGIACAVALRRRLPSLRVAVFDRAHFPRNKPCGGGLTGRADQALQALGLSLNVRYEAAPRARVVCGGVERTLALARPVRVIRRDEFDASLVAQARGLGIEIFEGRPLDAFTHLGNAVELSVAGQSLRARILVGADGAGSVVRKALQHERRRPIRLLRAELPVTSQVPRDTMLYDFSAMRDGLRGYVWVFPSPGERINVGLMHDPSSPRSGAVLTQLLSRELRRWGVDLPPHAARGWPAWGYAAGATVAAPNLLLVGDAAGIDALTGEGIAVGLEGGIVAADAIVGGLGAGDLRFAGYRAALRRATVGRELAVDAWMARLIYNDAWGGWRRWLSLVLFDEKMLELYARRVCGTLILADHKPAMLSVLARHLALGRSRRRRLEAALSEVV